MIQNHHSNTSVKENIIQMARCVCKISLKCQIAKTLQKTSKVEPFFTRILLKQS